MKQEQSRPSLQTKDHSTSNRRAVGTGTSEHYNMYISLFFTSFFFGSISLTTAVSRLTRHLMFSRWRCVGSNMAWCDCARDGDLPLHVRCHGSPNGAFAGMLPSICLAKSRKCDVRHFSPLNQEPCFAVRRILLVGCARSDSSSFPGVYGRIFQSNCGYTAEPTKTTSTAIPARDCFVHEARGP